jgi:hypothetical protein
MAIHHTPGKSQVGVETSPAPGTTGTPQPLEAAHAPLSQDQGPGGSETPTSTPQAATGPHSGPREATETPANPATRPWTPDTSTTIKMKRACNGCGTRLGDVTDAEMARAINGLPLPDVRRECPTCGPTAPEPRCLPAPVTLGAADCLDGDCGHDIALDAEYCVEVRETYACATHSEISRDGAITRAEPWPCTHTKVTR